MDHFQGTTNEERYKNDVLNELRRIRIALERNAQAVEHKEVVNDTKRKERGGKQVQSTANANK